ncbi:single-stranded DNA-binding protein, partial [Edwardsiella tarda]
GGQSAPRQQQGGYAAPAQPAAPQSNEPPMDFDDDIPF